MPGLPRISLLIGAISLASATVAGNLDFLRDSPVAEFTEDDAALLRQAANEVLTDSEPRAKREWKNPATGHFGQVEVLGSFKSGDGRACKRLQVTNQAKSAQGRSTYSVCRSVDSDWAVDPSARPPAR